MHFGTLLIQQELVEANQFQVGLRCNVVIATLRLEVFVGSLSLYDASIGYWTVVHSDNG